MLEVIIGIGLIALISALLYFFSPQTEQNDVDGNPVPNLMGIAFRIIFLFLCLISMFGTVWFTLFYATAGTVTTTTFSYMNITTAQNASNVMTYATTPVVSSQTETIAGTPGLEGPLSVYLLIIGVIMGFIIFLILLGVMIDTIIPWWQARGKPKNPFGK